MIKTIYLDMDGVLCDWINPAVKVGAYNKETDVTDWNIIKTIGARFWSELPWLKSGKELYKFLYSYCRSTEKRGDPNAVVRLCILSSVGFDAGVIGKRAWLNKHTKIKPLNVNIVNRGLDKQRYADSESLLIDDYSKNVRQFMGAGGNAILFKDDAEEAISKVKALLDHEGDTNESFSLFDLYKSELVDALNESYHTLPSLSLVEYDETSKEIRDARINKIIDRCMRKDIEPSKLANALIHEGYVDEVV